ncbi:MAG: hypothetical protein WCD86_28130 [Ktedonobacteraceae bacterium]
MASRNAPQRSSSSHSAIGSDPFLMLGVALVALIILTIGLPAILIGFFAWRFTSRLFRHHWKLSFLFWFLLFLPAAWLFFSFAQHGFQQLIATQLTDVVQTAKHAGFDPSHWNVGRLWAVTWPVWLRTLPAIPLVGVWQEISAQTRSGQIAAYLVQSERSRERRSARAKLRARKRTRRPERLPDQVGGLMVIGVPIDGDEEQE